MSIRPENCTSTVGEPMGTVAVGLHNTCVKPFALSFLARRLIYHERKPHCLELIAAYRTL